MKKILTKIEKRINAIWLGYSDRILHFLFGYLIGSMFQGAGYYMVIPPVIVGALKEYHDAKRDKLGISFRSVFNADWACTAGGGFFALFMYAVSLYLFGVHLPDFITVLINR